MHIPRAATRRWLVVALLAVATMAAPVTGAAKAQKAIVISISNQTLWAYKDQKVVLSTYVSTGRAGFDTPVGSFAVLTKLPSQPMGSVIGGEYYNVWFDHAATSHSTLSAVSRKITYSGPSLCTPGGWRRTCDRQPT